MLAIGTALKGGVRCNFAESGDFVSVTEDPARAAYWARQAAARAGLTGEVFVYEIDPVGDLFVWRAGKADYGKRDFLWEGRCEVAMVKAVFVPEKNRSVSRA